MGWLGLSIFLCVSMIFIKHTSFTSLYNGFVDLLMKDSSFTSLYNGFVDSGDMMLQLVWPELPKALSLLNS